MTPFLQVPSLGGPSYLTQPSAVVPQLTATAYSNETYPGSNVTRTGFNFTWESIPSVPTGGSGGRVILYVWTYRALSSKLTSVSNANTWYASNTMTAGGNSMTYIGYTATSYNGTSAWIYNGDLSGDVVFANSFPSNAGGEYASSLFVLDYITSYSYNGDFYYANASNQYYSSYLNVTAPNLTGGTHALRAAFGTTSNSGTNPVYNKGVSEPTYTSLGSGDNGTDERNVTAYAFEANTTPVSMTGRCYSSDDANNGVSVGGVLLELK